MVKTIHNFYITLFTMSKVTLQYIFELALLVGWLSLCNASTFPPPIGNYSTSIVTAELVDHHRLDPYAPTPKPRALMISIFWPVPSALCILHKIPYMDAVTAAFEDSEYAVDGVLPDTLESLTLEDCQKTLKSNPNHRHLESGAPYPLVLFSTGMGNSRLLYSSMAQQ